MDDRIFKIRAAGYGILGLLFLLLVFGIYHSGKMAYRFGYRIFTETAMDTPEEGKDVPVYVSPGISAKELGQLLEKRGLIRDARLFFFQLNLSSYKNKIKEGTYLLSTSMTAQEMMQIMSSDPQETETEE